MHCLKIPRTRILITAAASLLVISSVYAQPAAAPTTYVALEPNRSLSLASLYAVSSMKRLHYMQLKLDDNLSGRMLDSYLKALDGSRLYFTAADISDFNKYRTGLDDALKAGDLKPAFAIYNRFQQRAAERMDYVIQQLNQGIGDMHFDTEESIDLDREKAPWIQSRQELDQLWDKRLKATVLNLKLQDKPLEDIQKLLLKRYHNQLTRLYQVKAEDAFQSYMNAYTEAYDPHTEYFSPRTQENFNINMSLSLEGIGAVLQNDEDYTKVIRLVPGGPADKAHQLKPGDRITGVAQGKGEMIDVVGWRIDDVVQKIRGDKGTEVRLEVIPANANESDTHVISITRNTVNLEDQAAQKKIIEVTRNGRKYKVGVIDLPAFYADFQGMQNGDPNYRSSTRDVTRLLRELMAAKVDAVIMDLRNNGGGSLSEANSLLGLFIETGPVVQVRDARGKVEVMEDTDPTVVYNGPLAVMVNRLSASASEIFAGAIQDYGRGLILGSTTFGKGTVQSLRDLNLGQLKLTEAKFYRISGGSNQNKGIIPDISFPSLVPDDDIGESALPNALPWDTIRPARYPLLNDYSPQLPLLRQKHNRRIGQSPDFTFLLDQASLFNELRKDKQVSLREVTRRQKDKTLEDRRLAMENRRRQANGQDALKKLPTPEEEATRTDEERNRVEDDAFRQEAGEIVIDQISSQERVARNRPRKMARQ